MPLPSRASFELNAFSPDTAGIISVCFKRSELPCKRYVPLGIKLPVQERHAHSKGIYGAWQCLSIGSLPHHTFSEKHRRNRQRGTDRKMDRAKSAVSRAFRIINFEYKDYVPCSSDFFSI